MEVTFNYSVYKVVYVNGNFMVLDIVGNQINGVLRFQIVQKYLEEKYSRMNKVA